MFHGQPECGDIGDQVVEQHGKRADSHDQREVREEEGCDHAVAGDRDGVMWRGEPGWTLPRSRGTSRLRAMEKTMREIPMMVVRNTLAVAIIAPSEMTRTAPGSR